MAIQHKHNHYIIAAQSFPVPNRDREFLLPYFYIEFDLLCYISLFCFFVVKRGGEVYVVLLVLFGLLRL